MSAYVGNEPAPAGVILVGDTNPIGAIAFFHAPPDGSYLVLNGQVVSKTTYAALWAYAQGFLTADQTANPGLYRSVDANTFALPKLDGLFIRAQGTLDANSVSAALGVKQAFATGKPSGGAGMTSYWGSGTGGNVNVTYGAGATNATPPFDAETRPANVALVACVKALRVVIMPSAAMPPATPIIGTPVNASGTFVDFPIFPGARLVLLNVAGLSTSGTSNVRFQLGAVGTIEATGYVNGEMRGGGAGDLTGGNSTAGFETVVGLAATSVLHGIVTLALLNSAANVWTCSQVLGQSDSPRAGVSGGSKTLAGVLDRVRVTTGNGTDLLDAGALNVIQF